MFPRVSRMSPFGKAGRGSLSPQRACLHSATNRQCVMRIFLESRIRAVSVARKTSPDRVQTCCLGPGRVGSAQAVGCREELRSCGTVWSRWVQHIDPLASRRSERGCTALGRSRSCLIHGDARVARCCEHGVSRPFFGRCGKAALGALPRALRRGHSFLEHGSGRLLPPGVAMEGGVC